MKLRDSMRFFRVLKINLLDRGWSGLKMPGRSLGPPDAVREDTYEGFVTRVSEMKTVLIMKGNSGRTSMFLVLM